MRNAYVASGSIGKVYHSGSGYTDPQGNKFSSAVWRNRPWLTDNNLYEVVDGSGHDATFYKNGSAALSWDDKKKLVVETITRKDRDVADIKTTLLDKTLIQMKAALESTKWHVERKTSDSSYTIPDDVKAHITAVYAKYDTYVKNINAKTTLKALQTMMLQTVDDKTTGELWDFPDAEGKEKI